MRAAMMIAYLTVYSIHIIIHVLYDKWVGTHTGFLQCEVLYKTSPFFFSFTLSFSAHVGGNERRWTLSFFARRLFSFFLFFLFFWGRSRWFCTRRRLHYARSLLRSDSHCVWFARCRRFTAISLGSYLSVLRLAHLHDWTLLLLHSKSTFIAIVKALYAVIMLLWFLRHRLF